MREGDKAGVFLKATGQVIIGLCHKGAKRYYTGPVIGNEIYTESKLERLNKKSGRRGNHS